MMTDTETHFRETRLRMIDDQLRSRGLGNESVLMAMRTVPRHHFVPTELTEVAYIDRALPLGPQQTISQPYVVALMTQLAADHGIRTSGRDRALEIGTGSGYQAAVLAELFGQVTTIELDTKLAQAAKTRLSSLGYRNVSVRAANGLLGAPDAAPFDAIVVTAAVTESPNALMQQLRVGGRLIYPFGTNSENQILRIARRIDASECEERPVGPVRFVPLQIPSSSS